MATRNKTSISKEQVSDRAVQRSHITTDVGLIRTHKVGVLFYAGEIIAKTFTDVNSNEYIKTFTVKTDFTGSSNFSNDLTNYLVDNSVIQNKADKVGAGYTSKVASFDANGNLQSSGYDQSGLHTHSNLSVLNAISDAGSGQIITAIERNKLNGIEAGAQLNTISNVGTSGVGIYKNKVGSQFNLKKIDSIDNKISVNDDTPNDRIQLQLNEANINLPASQISVTDTNGYLDATDVQTAFDNLSLQTKANTWRIGNNAAGDKYLRFGISAGPNDPGFRYLNSGTKVQYSNDGTTWNDFNSVSETFDTPTIVDTQFSFVASSAPSGSFNGSCRVHQIGKHVNLRFTFDFSIPGTAVTQISIDTDPIDSSLPTPAGPGDIAGGMAYGSLLAVPALFSKSSQTVRIDIPSINLQSGEINFSYEAA